ncbi:MAG: glycine cleavage system protein GcvH [Actinomycetota bacterium]|nr:glycine cleavage system protein GcvH [Actinomycetota bacterium]
MATVSNCNLPEDLYYLVEKHVWARMEDGLVVVGLTDVAQNLAKKILSVSPKAAGKRVGKGRSVATVESSKWVGPVPTPVSGEIVEVNQGVLSEPATINRDPYGAGWIAKLRAEDWEADVADLKTGEEGIAAYQAFLEAEGIICVEA